MSIQYDQWVKEINKVKPKGGFIKDKPEIQKFVKEYFDKGYSADQIASALKISRHTVDVVRKIVGLKKKVS